MSKSKKLSQQEYKELFEKHKNDVLLEGEEARQMLNHRPYLFVTDKGRILSVGKERIRVLKQSLRAQTYTKSTNGNNEKKHCVCIGENGKTKVYYVHCLVAEYFQDKVTSFITNKDKQPIIHHIRDYDSNSDKNNATDNLIKINQDIHRLMHSMKMSPTSEEREKWRKKLYKALGDKHCVIYKRDDKRSVGVIELSNDDFELLNNNPAKINEYLKEKGID